MLNGRLLLHDGVDAEKLARKALNDALRSRHVTLSAHRYEDALAELVTAAWELSERFQPGRGHSFSTGCYRLLRFRFTDWIRRTEGRTTWVFATHTYERERPVIVSLDDADVSGRLGNSVAAGSRDPSDDRSPDLVRALVRRGCRTDGHDEASRREGP